ncbi:hypothetical protein DASC09_011860 [Saccharomycopsis crataegensis]|uniref:DASH complex subunit DAD2 n=1 Tax=Saccharomycopsis crataegensis TaxID=43959 RepID=A0AAV5QGL6_9ASCO|nr:hypothetical protein DASC09_011860 [Saccharomycopsis crataegensis]
MDGTNIRLSKIQKERELMALQQVSYSVEQLKHRLESIVDRFEKINEGTEAVKIVLSNWNDVKRVISMATLSLANYSDEDYRNSGKLPLTEGAVRVLIENEEIATAGDNSDLPKEIQKDNDDDDNNNNSNRMNGEEETT